MSWSAEATGSHDEVKQRIGLDHGVPPGVRTSVDHVLSALEPGSKVTVTTSGHIDPVTKLGNISLHVVTK